MDPNRGKARLIILVSWLLANKDILNSSNFHLEDHMHHPVLDQELMDLGCYIAPDPAKFLQPDIMHLLEVHRLTSHP